LISSTVQDAVYKRGINQLSNIQRSVTTVGYEELRRTSVSIKLSLITVRHIQKLSAVYFL